MDSTVKLIAQTFAANSIGEQVATETKKEVLARIQSVSGEEWDRAARNDLQAVFRVLVSLADYDGERVLEYNSKRYGVYRVYYPDDSDDVELYAEQKAGVEV